MKDFHQLKLALWKDYTIRKRHPCTLIFVFSWAVCMFSTILIVRESIDTYNQPSCHFSPRALPSAGLLPFVQSFLCNLNNQCEDIKKKLPVFEDSKVGKLMTKAEPLISNKTFIDILNYIPQATKLMRTVMTVLDNEDLENLLLNGIELKRLIRNEDELRKFLQNANIISNDTFQHLLNGRINFINLALAFKKYNQKESVCNNEILKTFLYIDQIHLKNVSVELCRLNQLSANDLLQNILKHINYEEVMGQVDNILHQFGHEKIFTNIGKMINTVFKLQPLQKFIPSNLETLKNWLPEIIPVIKGLNSTNFDIKNLNMVIDYLEPAMNKSKNWILIKRSANNMISLLSLVQDMLLNKSNGLNSTAPNISTIFNRLKFDLTVLQMNSDVLHSNTSSKVYDYINTIYSLLNNTVMLTDNIYSNKINSPLIIIDILDIIKDVFPFLSALEETSDTINEVLQIVNDIIVTHIDAEKILFNTWKQHSYALKIVYSLGPNNTKKIPDSLKDLNNAEFMLKNINNVSAIFCNTKKLTQIFGKKSMHLNEIKNMLCRDEWINFVTDIGKKMHYKDIMNSINNINSHSSITKINRSKDKANFRQLYFNVEKLLNIVSGLFVAPNNDELQIDYDWYKFREGGWKKMYKKIEDDKDLYLLSIDLAILKHVIETSKFPKTKMYNILSMAEVVLSGVKEILQVISVNSSELNYNKNDFDRINMYYNENQYFDWYKFAESMKNVHFTYKDLIKKQMAVSFRKKLDLKSVFLLSAKISTTFLEILDPGFKFSDEWQRLKIIMDFVNTATESFNNALSTLIENNGLNVTMTFKKIPETGKLIKVILKGLPEIFNTTEQHVNASIIKQFVLSNDWPCSNPSLVSLFQFKDEGAIAVKLIEDALCYPTKYLNEWRNNTHIQTVIRSFTTTNDLSSNFDWRLGYNNFKHVTYLIEQLQKYNGTFFKDIPEVDYHQLFLFFSNKTREYSDNYNKYQFERTFFKLIDNYLQQIVHSSQSLSDIWFDYGSCLEDNETCTEMESDAINQTIIYVPEVFHDILNLFLEYYHEINDPETNLLQAIGFIENTGVYIFYKKFPELINVFLYSYKNKDFLNELDVLYNSTGKIECQSIFKILKIPPNNTVTSKDIDKLSSYVCPGIVIPVLDENVFLKVSGLAQNLYYEPIDTFNVSYEILYDKLIEFSRETNKILDKKPTFTVESVLSEEWLNNVENTLLSFLEKRIPNHEAKIVKRNNENKIIKILQLLSNDWANILSLSLKYYNQENCKWCSSTTKFIKEFNKHLLMSQNYSDLVCNSINMNFTTFLTTLKDEFEWNKIPVLFSSNETYKYEDFIIALQEFFKIFPSEFLELHNNETYVEEMKTCFEDFLNSPSVSSIQSIIHFASTVMNFTVTSFNKLDQILELQNDFKPFLSIIENNTQVFRPTSEILKSKEAFYIKALKLNYSIEFLETFVDSKININELLNITEEQLYEYLTSDTKLQHLFDSIDVDKFITEVNEHNLSGFVRTFMEEINVSFIQENFSKWRHDYVWSFTWIPDLIRNSEKIFEHSQAIMNTIRKLNINNFTLESVNMLDIADGMLQILQGDTIDHLYKNLHELINDLSSILNHSLLERDLNTLLDGINSIRKLLRSGFISFKYHTKSLFSNWKDLNNYFINTLHLSPDVSEAIVNSDIDIKPILEDSQRERLDAYVCKPENIEKILVNNSVNYNQELIRGISDELCTLDPEMVQNMTDTLVEHVNYGEILNGLQNKTLENLFKKSNLTSVEGLTVLNRLKRAESFAPQLQVYTEEIHDFENKLETYNDSSSTNTDIVQKLSSLICGKRLIQKASKIEKMLAEEIRKNDNIDPSEYDSLSNCKNLYEDIINMDNGKIIWTYAKQLLRGKILVTPKNKFTEKIMTTMNSTFANLAIAGNVINSFGEVINFLSDINVTSISVKLLKELLDSSYSRDILSFFNIDTALQDDFNFNDISNIMTNFKTEMLKTATAKVLNIMKCVNYNRFQAVADEVDLEKQAKQLMKHKEFLAGIVFTNDFGNGNNFPSNIVYKIRMDIDNVPTTSIIKEQFWAPGPNGDFIQDLRYFRGFIQLQDMLDKTLINLQSNYSSDYPTNGIYTQQFPYPCWKNDAFQPGLYASQTLMVCFYFALIIAVGSMVRFRVWERESQNTMMMNIMGMKTGTHFLSWFLVSLSEIWIIMLCIFAILKGGNILPRTNPVILLLFLLNFGLSIVTFCFMVSEMFKTASLACVASVMYYLFSFIPYFYHIVGQLTPSFSTQIILNLCMSSSLSYAFFHITRYEIQDIGLQWHNLWDSTLPTKTINAGLCFTIMLVDSLIYIILGYIIMYIRKETVAFKKLDAFTINEEESKVGVTIENITKVFNSSRKNEKVAVDNVSLRLYKSQLTTILGQNGAGKTTLINILTGMKAPTSGNIMISDPKYNAIKSIRQYLGVCPQASILIGKLSAREHLTFYAMLKTSLPKSLVEKEVVSMLKSMNLGSLEDEPVINLSGGMKRRLCVGIAFIGGPNLVVLDEPSSGVDPVARRYIWDLIISQKKDRTIVLTTHHLDEAELLSDQIVILHKGKVNCSGTPLTLKQNYGHGYLLDVIYHPGPTARKIDNETVQRLFTTIVDVVPNVHIISISKCKVTLALPFLASNGEPNNFEKAARVLEDEQFKLKYNEFSFNCTTFEKIFLNILKNADDSEDGAKQNSELETVYQPNNHGNKNKSSANSAIEFNSFENIYRSKKSTRMTGSWYDIIWALIVKRFVHYTLDRRVFISAIVLPVLFTAAAMGSYLLRPPSVVEPALQLRTDMFEPNGVSFISINGTKFTSDIQEYLFSSSSNNTSKEFITYNELNTNCYCANGVQQCVRNNFTSKTEHNLYVLPSVNQTVNWLIDTQKDFIERRYGGWSFGNQKEENEKSITVWYNNKGFHALPSYMNTLSNAILRTKCPECKITIYSHPLQLSPDKLGKDTLLQYFTDVSINIIVLVGFSLAASNGIVFLVQERINEEKRLQYLSGVTPFLYWSVAFIWDFLVFVISLGFCLIIFKVFGLPIYVAKENLNGVCLLLLLYGWSVVPINHLVEKMFKDSSLANMFMFCGNVLVFLVTLICILVLDIVGSSETTLTVRYYFHNVFLFVPQYIAGNGLLEISKNHITADLLSRFGLDAYISPTSWELLGRHYVTMCLIGPFFFIINLLVEYKFSLAKRQRYTTVKDKSIILETKNLRKEFSSIIGKHVAVDSLSLKILPGQCFGLLGVNGAGKSTTFKMLISEIRPTQGKIFIENEEIVSGRSLYSGQLGYCPQIDAMDPKLTTLQCLKLYGKLKGVQNISYEADSILKKFGLTSHAHQRFENLSGGNKRKVCAAVSVLGKSRIILMDEPTSGMDPASRVLISYVLNELKQEGRSVILTSHSMEECEMLCSDVAIMIQGKVACNGTPAGLKTRYGGGYLISIRLQDENMKDALNSIMRKSFPASIKQNQQYCSSQYLIPMANELVSNIFSKMSQISITHQIVDFSLEQSSLDQVFINLCNTWNNQEQKSTASSNSIELEDMSTNADDLLSIRL